MEKLFKKILVATDFSAGADAALELALALRQQLGASVTLLHVYDAPNVYTEVYPFGVDLIAEMERGAREAMTALVERAKARAAVLGGESSPITGTVVAGVPQHTIVEIAADADYDLIVVGTHGRTGLRRVMIGSVAERVVRRAPCAVLTVRGP